METCKLEIHWLDSAGEILQRNKIYFYVNAIYTLHNYTIRTNHGENIVDLTVLHWGETECVHGHREIWIPTAYRHVALLHCVTEFDLFTIFTV